MEIAGKKERLINCIVDMIFIILFAFILRLIIGLFVNISEKEIYIIVLFTFIGYYIIFEWISGRTPGKIISYTRVVKKDLSKINFIQALLRTIIRLTGLVPFTILFGSEIGIHDILTNTRVMIDKNEKKPSL